MNELVITKAVESLTMDSREIAELTGKEHRNVLRDIENQLGKLEGGVLRFEHTYTSPQNGMPYRYFKLPYRETMILVSGYSVELRAKIVDRWMKLEQKAAMEAFNIPKDYPSALRLCADQAELLAAQAPKVEAYESLMRTYTTMSITDASKHFGLHPKLQVFPFLRERGYLTSKDLPTQKAIDADILTTRQNENKAQGKTYTQAVVEACQLDNFRRLVAMKIAEQFALLA